MADDKRAGAVTMTADELKNLVSETATAVAVALEKSRPAVATKAATKVRKATCPECHQLNMACGGKHRYIKVMPNYNSEWFKGVFINGVRYCSDAPIAVPADADVEYQVSLWEENERALLTGRKRLRNSGNIHHGTRPLTDKDFFR